MRQLSLAICSGHLISVDISELIILSDDSQNSTRVQCYFHCLWNHSIDYFDDTGLDSAVIYTGDVLFKYNEHKGMYMEFSGNPTGNVFLAASREHDFLIIYKGKMSNISKNSMNLQN